MEDLFDDDDIFPLGGPGIDPDEVPEDAFDDED